MKFHTFIPTHTLLTSVLHFFPSSQKVVAPYPVTCKITFFSEKRLIKSVVLDGLRLSHPDGVRVEDLLAGAAADAPGGLVGVEIEIDTKGRNTDLSESDCLVELECQDNSLHYRARPYLKKGDPERVKRVPLFCGELGSDTEEMSQHTSLVFVNSSETEQQLTYHTVNGSTESVEMKLEPRAVVERRLDDSAACCVDGDPLQMVELSHEGAADSIVGYILYRDVKTNLPLSVSSL